MRRASTFSCCSRLSPCPPRPAATARQLLHFSFRHVREQREGVDPLVGPWQLGTATLKGSGTLGGGQLGGQIVGYGDRCTPGTSRPRSGERDRLPGRGAPTGRSTSSRSTSRSRADERRAEVRARHARDPDDLRLEGAARLERRALGLCRHGPLDGGPPPDLRPGLDERRRRPEDEPRPRRPAARGQWAVVNISAS